MLLNTSHLAKAFGAGLFPSEQKPIGCSSSALS